MGIFKLKGIRNEKELTQHQMATILNVSRSTYSGWESEIDNIPLLKLNDFCNKFNYSLDYISNLTNLKQYNLDNTVLDLTIISNRLKLILEEQKITQKQLAFELNIQPSTITHYINGRSMIQSLFVYYIAKKYNYSMDWIVGRTNINNL